MNTLTPTSPLLTLVIEPKEGTTTKNLLAQFHPIMKSLGFGHFEMEEDAFYSASKGGDGIFQNELFVFAEVDSQRVTINIDGRSIFGLKGVEQQLRKVKEEFENKISCTATVLGPNYFKAFLGNLLYTALPIYASAGIILLMMNQEGSFKKQYFFNVLIYATLAVIGAKTRFWVNQRRKQRPVWKSILILLFAAPIILGIAAFVFWVVGKFV